jgi:hypothetical protein
VGADVTFAITLGDVKHVAVDTEQSLSAIVTEALRRHLAGIEHRTKEDHR